MSDMTGTLGVIADDFTGALMVAGYLEAVDIYSPVAFDAGAVAELRGAPVAIVAGRTRTIARGDALAEATRLTEALDGIGCTRIAYKACGSFDSTEDGNIGPIADLLAERSGIRPVLMSAGFPELGITVHQGYLFYAGRLVTDSIKRFDPLTPMPDPDLVRFLGRQTPHRVGLINHRALREGPAHVQTVLDALSAEGVGHVLFDATDDDDVAVTADVAAARPCVVAASDPLIIALAKRLAGRTSGAPPPLPRHASGSTAVLVGSVGSVAQAQLDCFAKQHPVHTLDLLDPRGEAAAVAEALAFARQMIGASPCAVTALTSPEAITRGQAALTPIGAARRAERMLGAVAAGLFTSGVRRFVVSGGETSGAVVAALAVKRVRSLPRGDIGTGFCVAEGDDPLSLYLKPGKLGPVDVLLRAVNAMQT